MSSGHWSIYLCLESWPEIKPGHHYTRDLHSANLSCVCPDGPKMFNDKDFVLMSHFNMRRDGIHVLGLDLLVNISSSISCYLKGYLKEERYRLNFG